VRSGSKVTVLRSTPICFIARPRLPNRLLERHSRYSLSAAFPQGT
jgi:hypothetical protein